MRQGLQLDGSGTGLISRWLIGVRLPISPIGSKLNEVFVVCADLVTLNKRKVQHTGLGAIQFVFHKQITMECSMTEGGWIVLGVVGAISSCLMTSIIGVWIYLLYQHKKTAHTQELASTVIDTVDHPKILVHGHLIVPKDTATKSMLRLVLCKKIYKDNNDITIFNNGIIQPNTPWYECTYAFTVPMDWGYLFLYSIVR